MLHLFQNHPVPKKHETFLLDKAFSYLTNPSESIAIRVFSMTVIFNISKPYPDLLNELQLAIHHLVETESSAAILSRSKKTLAQINIIKKDCLKRQSFLFIFL